MTIFRGLGRISAMLVCSLLHAELAAADAYSSLIAEQRPIAYWRMHESRRISALDMLADLRANDRSLRLLDLAGATDSSGDTATELPDGESWVTVPHVAFLNPKNAFTITFLARLRANPTSYQNAISTLQWSRSAYKGYRIAVHPTNNRWYFFTGAGPTIQAVSGGFHVPGQWDHIAVTWKADGGTNSDGVPTGGMAIHVNGSKATQNAAGAYLPADRWSFNNIVWWIGANYSDKGSYRWDGDINEVALFGNALTDDQIRIQAETALAVSHRTFYVRKSGNDANNGLSPGTAFATFEHGFRHLRAGDTLYIGAGEYASTECWARFDGTGRDGAPVRILGDPSGERTGDAGDVILRGRTPVTGGGDESERSSCIFYASWARNIHVEGITFADGGYATYFYDCHNTTIENCKFTGQKSASICCDYGSATVDRCHIHENANHGILAYRGNYTVRDTQILDCASGYGLHFYRHPEDSATQNIQCHAENVTIRGSGSWALRVYCCNAALRDCLIEDNHYGVICFGGSSWIDVVVDDEEGDDGSNEELREDAVPDAGDPWIPDEDAGIPKLHWHPTVLIENTQVRRCKNSWAIYTAYTNTTLRNCTIENNIHGVLCYDSDARCDTDRLHCIAEKITCRNNAGWALHMARVDAEARDITAENNRYGISFWDKERFTGSDDRCTVTAERLRVTGTHDYWGFRSVRVDLELCDSQFLDNARGIYLYEDENPVGTGSQVLLDRIEVRRSAVSWGLYCCRADLDLRNSLIADNSHGIYCREMDEGSQLWHVSVINNDAYGIYNRDGFMAVYNCLVTGAGTNYGLINHGGTLVNDHNLVVGNNRDYSHCHPGPGSVYGVPLFADTDDYHLLDTSPGVHGGTDPGSLCPRDLEGYERCQNGGWNVGCYATTVPGWEYDDLEHAYASNRPIAWWRLGEGVGDDTAIDCVGNNHGRYENGVRRGCVSPVSEDGCAFFDGRDDQIRISHSERYMLDRGTVLLWYRTFKTPDPWSGIFSKDSQGFGGGGQVSLMTHNSTYGRPYAYHQTIDASLPVYPDTDSYQSGGEWTFIAYSFGSHGVTLYINGAMAMREASHPEGWGTTSGGSGNDEPIFLGASSYWSARGETYPDQRLNGWIDEVAIFDRQLSATEIVHIYRASVQPKRDPEAMQIPPLWGVTSKKGYLFRIDDYRDPSGSTTCFGQISWNQNGTPVPVDDQIDSITIDSGGTAYLLVNKDLGDYAAPLLMRIHLQQVESGTSLIATPIATSSAVSNIQDQVEWKTSLIATPMGTIDNMAGIHDIAIDPATGILYALGGDGRLSSIDPTTGHTITDFGELKNEALGLGVENGKALIFDSLGGLFVLDAFDNHLYRVNKNSAVITRIVDSTVGGGYEAAAWDQLNFRAVASNTVENSLHQLSLMPGNNPSFGSFHGAGLKEVAGLSFIPNEGQGSAAGGWRVIQWLEVR